MSPPTDADVCFPAFRYNKPKSSRPLFCVGLRRDCLDSRDRWLEGETHAKACRQTNQPTEQTHARHKEWRPTVQRVEGGRGDSLFAALSLNSGQKVETFFSPLMMKEVELRPLREPGEKFQCRRKRRRRRRKTGQRQSCLDRLLNIVAVLSSSSLPFYSPSFSVP